MHLDSDKSEHLNPYPYQNGMNIMLFDRNRHRHILFLRTKCQRKPLLFYNNNNLFFIRKQKYEKENIELQRPNIDRILHTHTNTNWRKIRERSQTQPYAQRLPTNSYSLKHTQTHKHTHTHTQINTHTHTPTHTHTHTDHLRKCASEAHNLFHFWNIGVLDID